MTTDYETLYLGTPEALGPQNPVIARLIADHVAREARVLDIGCGQGRDALPLAARGHEVVGVDIAPSGVAAMMAAARAADLPVSGIVADLRAFTPEGRFGLLLCDRTLHMLPRPDRAAVLRRLLQAITAGGWCLIVDEPCNMPALRMVIAADPGGWEFPHETRDSLLARRRMRDG